MSQFYGEAVSILKRLERRNGSLKSLVFCSQDKSLRQKKRLYALVYKTLKYKGVISQVVTMCKLLEKEPKLAGSLHLCLVLVCDILYGKGLQCGGALKTAMQQHIEEMKTAWRSVKNSPVSTDQGVQLPRYARMNTLKASSKDILCRLREEGFQMKEPEEICSCTCLGQIEGKGSTMKNCFSCDRTIDEVLMFCQCTRLVDTQVYSQSLLIIQDKASCLSAHVLAPAPGSHVIDACAAPGNKTTHLASIMQNQGLIYAFDKDPKRFETLTKMVSRAGATNVQLQLADFLTVDPSCYRDVTHILVDPSCSGSGIYDRLSYDESAVDHKRLAQLSKFQCKILNHALSFPAVKRVVYSTCSVHKQENEYVVRNILMKNASSFELVHILPDWPSRGLPVFTKGDCCIRSSAEEKTNGFFVAMFQRKSTR